MTWSTSTGKYGNVHLFLWNAIMCLVIVCLAYSFGINVTAIFCYFDHNDICDDGIAYCIHLFPSTSATISLLSLLLRLTSYTCSRSISLSPTHIHTLPLSHTHTHSLTPPIVLISLSLSLSHPTTATVV